MPLSPFRSVTRQTSKKSWSWIGRKPGDLSCITWGTRWTHLKNGAVNLLFLGFCHVDQHGFWRCSSYNADLPSVQKIMCSGLLLPHPYLWCAFDKNKLEYFTYQSETIMWWWCFMLSRLLVLYIKPFSVCSQKPVVLKNGLGVSVSVQLDLLWTSGISSMDTHGTELCWSFYGSVCLVWIFWWLSMCGANPSDCQWLVL